MIEVYRRNTVPVDLNVTEDGQPADCTDMEIIFTIKPQSCGDDMDDSKAVVKKTFTLSDTPTVKPQASLFLTEDDMDIPVGDYLCDTKYFVDNQIVNSSQEVWRVLQPVTNRDLPDES